MDKNTKNHIQNKPVLKASKVIKPNGNTNVPERQKKGCKGLKRGLKGIDPVSILISFDSLIRCSSIILSLMLHYRLNNRVDVYVILVLISHPDPLSLSALTRLAGVSNASYVAESLRRLIGMDIVSKSYCYPYVYSLSVPCKDKILQLIDAV